MKSNSTTNRWWDLPAASLLLVALATAASRLEVTGWTEHLNIPRTLVVLGVLAGLALGQSSFSPRVSRFLGFAYGLFAVPWLVGNTIGNEIGWQDRLFIIGERLMVIILQIYERDVVQDSLLFVVLMAVLFWFLSVHAGYTLTRYANAWRAILPTGLAIFVIHTFDPVIPRRAWYLAVYLFFSLVLVARVTFLQHRASWRKSRTALPPNLGLDFIRFALIATAVIVLFAWTAPALAQTIPSAERVYQRIRQPWNILRDNFDNAFASLQATVGVVNDYYGSSVVLGRGNRLTDQPVLLVKVNNPPPRGIRFYWRGRSYDTYLNGQWHSTPANSIFFDPLTDEFEIGDYQGRWLGSFEIIAQAAMSTMLTPEQPVWVSRSVRASLDINPDDTADIVTFRTDPSIQAGDFYIVEASVSAPTIAQMLSAGEDYPEWVEERYLQLPDTITDRTRALAEQITAGLDTPYEKVVAVTQYLRENITYNETVPVKPNNREAVDWFLFDIREGFCNYYASAEVVLLRSIGIPARWSAGYAQGERQEDGRYLVRQQDAHAWPEVYFPNIGWVEFEPTVSQEPIARLEGSQGLNFERDFGEDDRPTPPQENLPEVDPGLLRERDMNQAFGGDLGVGESQLNAILSFLPWVASLAAAGTLLFLAWRYQERLPLDTVPIAMERSMLRLGFTPPKRLRLWAYRASLSPMAKAYLEINRALTRLGSPPSLAETPSERGLSLERSLPEVADPTRRLVSAYEAGMFSIEEPDVDSASADGREIRSVSYRAWAVRFFQRLIAPIQKPERSRYRHLQMDENR